MHQMLHAMHRDRRVRAVDVQDALHPQHLLAVAMQQHGQPHAEHCPVECAIDGKREGGDGPVRLFDDGRESP